MIWSFFSKNHTSYLLYLLSNIMAEASMTVYGAAIGVAIALAVVTFSLRGKGHSEPLE